MIGSLFEDYSSLPDGLPFILHVDLLRTPYTIKPYQNWHDEPEIQLCTDGRGTVLIDGVQYDFVPGDIAAVDSGVIHWTGTRSELVYTCLIVSADFCRHAGINCDALRFTPHFRDAALAEKMKRMCAIHESTDPLRTAKLQAELLGILIHLAEHHAATASVPKLPAYAHAHAHDTVKAAIRFIREHYSEKITLDRLARAVCADKYALCREFSRFTGQTIVTYLNHYRCMMASAAMASGCPVAETARLCGFESTSFFTRTFKKYMGFLPSHAGKL